MKTITKMDMMKVTRERLKKPSTIILPIINDFLLQINTAMLNGDRVYMRDFGVFITRQHKATKARNPRTNLPVDVPAKKVIRFTCSKKMKERLNARNSG